MRWGGSGILRAFGATHPGRAAGTGGSGAEPEPGMALARSVAPGAFRNGFKSKDEARSGCGEARQPQGCRRSGERCPRIPRKAGLCPRLRWLGCPQPRRGSAGRAGRRPRRVPGSKGLVLPRENKIWVSGEEARQQPGSRRCWQREDAGEASDTGAGRRTLKANSFPFEIPEFQSTTTTPSYARQGRIAELKKCSCWQTVADISAAPFAFGW